MEKKSKDKEASDEEKKRVHSGIPPLRGIYKQKSSGWLSVISTQGSRLAAGAQVSVYHYQT